MQLGSSPQRRFSDQASSSQQPGQGNLGGIVPDSQDIAQDDGLIQKNINNGQDVYISSSIDVVENVGDRK